MTLAVVLPAVYGNASNATSSPAARAASMRASAFGQLGQVWRPTKMRWLTCTRAPLVWPTRRISSIAARLWGSVIGSVAKAPLIQL